MRLIIAFFLLLTFWEPIHALIRQPPNSMYTWVHNHPEDYFFHLHVMRQGYEGAWNVITRMTPEEFPARLATPFFLLLGELGRMFPIGMGELYTLARALGAIALMLAIAGLIRRVFIDHTMRVLALMLTLTGTFWGDWSGTGIEVPVIVRSMWTELDPLMRLSFVPHHLWSKAIMVGIFMLILTNRSPIFVFMATVVMGFISPVILVTFVATLTLWVGIERRHVFPYIAGMMGSGLVMLYHFWLSKSSFPWTTYGPPWENNWLYLFPWWMYAQQFGPLLLLAVMGSIKSFRKNSIVRLLTCWVVVGWVFIFVLRPFLPFSNSRYLSGYQWIAVGILAAEGIRHLKRPIIVAVVMILLAVPSWYVAMRNAARRIDTNISNPQFFMPRDVRAAVTYLARITDTCTVAAPDWLSTMIAAYSSCRSVSGHRLMTWANDIKVYEMNAFFFQPKPLSEKAARIKQYGITHVITLDGITGTDILPLLAPTPAFTSGGVRVYNVDKSKI